MRQRCYIASILKLWTLVSTVRDTVLAVGAICSIVVCIHYGHLVGPALDVTVSLPSLHPWVSLLGGLGCQAFERDTWIRTISELEAALHSSRLRRDDTTL